MSGVDRFTRQGVGASDRAGFWVHASDFSQKMTQAQDREAYLQDQIDKWTALHGEHFKRAEILKLERDALQQRLTAADQQIDELTQERERLIAYGRSCGLDEASTLCSRMAYDAYYPAGSRFKVFTPKAQKALGDLLIKAANEIASLPGGPYERFKARQAKTAESAKSR